MYSFFRQSFLCRLIPLYFLLSPLLILKKEWILLFNLYFVKRGGMEGDVGLLKKFLEEQVRDMSDVQNQKAAAKAFPVIDLGRCSRCEGCIEIAPEVFRHNKETGSIDVIDMQEYPVDKINEAIKNCPEDCIFWDQ
jgi:ferredoxin